MEFEQPEKLLLSALPQTGRRPVKGLLQLAGAHSGWLPKAVVRLVRPVAVLVESAWVDVVVAGSLPVGTEVVVVDAAVASVVEVVG